MTVLCNGSKLADTAQLVSLTVQRAVNRVPSAQLVFVDGDMPDREFPLSDKATLIPGVAIKVNVGYGDDEQTIFEGIVVKHSIRAGGGNAGRLIVECRDRAVKLTVGRKNANYSKKKDSELIADLIREGGLAADVEETTTVFTDLVQYYASDWDFIVARAEANGLLVIATDGKLVVKAPATSGEPVLKVTWGADLIAFDAEIDARTQLAATDALAWSPKDQSTATLTARPATLNAQGNLDSAELARVVGLKSFHLQSGVPVATAVLQGWAKAQQQKAGLARIRGRMSFQGCAAARVGTLIDVVGIGARFSGSVFVGGVRHEIADGNWITEVVFGLAPDWFTAVTDIVAPPAAGLAPGIEGLQIGKVVKLDADPDGEQRVQVSIPVLGAGAQPVWARLMQLYASREFGAFFLPEIGDEVVLGFFNHDPSHPVIVGSLYSSNRKPPYALEAENNTKAIVTRTKLTLEFDEENRVITVITPAGNKVVLSDRDKSILLLDQNNNKVELNPSGVTVDTPKDIKMTAKGTVTIDAVGAITITSKADVKSSGLNVSCEGQVAFTGKGNASAELSASGQTTVRGAMVMIN